MPSRWNARFGRPSPRMSRTALSALPYRAGNPPVLNATSSSRKGSTVPIAPPSPAAVS